MSVSAIVNVKWKQLVLGLFAINSVCMAQKNVNSDIFHFSHLATYKLTYIQDSTKPLETQSSQQVLLINDTLSLTGSYILLNSDTTIYAFLNKVKTGGNQSPIHTRIDNIQYRIIKKDNIITTFDSPPFIFHQPVFKYEENKSAFAWQLEVDTATISGLPCQKAECDFGGRHWIAWFTTNISISDGPYKFCGLPGLIVRIFDIQKYWDFELTALVKCDYNFPIIALARGNYKNAKITTKEKFLRLLKQSYDNAFGLILNYNGANGTVSESDKERYRKWAKQIQDANNWIEPLSIKK